MKKQKKTHQSTHSTTWIPLALFGLLVFSFFVGDTLTTVNHELAHSRMLNTYNITNHMNVTWNPLLFYINLFGLQGNRIYVKALTIPNDKIAFEALPFEAKKEIILAGMDADNQLLLFLVFAAALFTVVAALVNNKYLKCICIFIAILLFLLAVSMITNTTVNITYPRGDIQLAIQEAQNISIFNVS